MFNFAGYQIKFGMTIPIFGSLLLTQSPPDSVARLRGKPLESDSVARFSPTALCRLTLGR
jgi:hypothetical protein